MARVELPASRLTARKRKRRIRAVSITLAALLVLAGGIVGATHIPALLIREVAVSGAETVASSTLRQKASAHLEGAYAFVIPKRNIFLYPQEEMEADLMKRFPVLASVDVHAVDFHTIAVNVVERHPRALWCEDAQCSFMDESGVVYAPAPIFSAPIYLSYRGAAEGTGYPKHYLTPTAFQSLSALADAIIERIPEEEARGVEVDQNGDVRMRFASGFVLMFKLSDPGGDVFERFDLALQSEPLSVRALFEFEYLDLRFGDKLYYKLKSE